MQVMSCRIKFEVMIGTAKWATIIAVYVKYVHRFYSFNVYKNLYRWRKEYNQYTQLCESVNV
jgi:hypothetical protein